MIMAETCHQVLKDAGVNPDRMTLEWASAAEGPRFVQIITDYVSRIKAMGPLGSAEGESGADVIRRRLEGAVKASEATKVRTSFGNLAKGMLKAGDYSPGVITEGVASKVLPAFRKERLSQELQLVIQEEGPGDVSTLCEKTGGNQEEIEKILGALAKKGVIREEGAVWALA
jgi:hypothetical protein